MITIKAAREALGYTQVDLAARADISPTTVSRMERGFTVNRKKLIKVCQVLNINPDEVDGLHIRNDYHSKT